MNEIEAIVQRTMRSIVTITQRVTRFATVLLLVAATVIVGSFLLGLAALSDGVRTVWAVLGIVFGGLAIGAALIARWGMARIRKDVPAIANEVRALIEDGQQPSQLIIQEFDDDTVSQSAIVMSRRVHGLRGMAGHGLEGAVRLTAAVKAITKFPLLALMTVMITMVFGFMALIFLLALAL